MIPTLEYQRWQLARTNEIEQKKRAIEALCQMWDVGDKFIGPFRTSQDRIQATEPFTNHWVDIATVPTYAIRCKLVDLLNTWWNETDKSFHPKP